MPWAAHGGPYITTPYGTEFYEAIAVGAAPEKMHWKRGQSNDLTHHSIGVKYRTIRYLPRHEPQPQHPAVHHQ